MKGFRPLERDCPGFSNVSSFMHLPVTTQLEGVDFAIVGVPFDTGGSWRVGCRFGPAAIRAISGHLGIWWPNDARKRINLFEYLSGIDYGDLPVAPGYHEESNRRITEGLKPMIGSGVVPILLGGDHSITLPALRAVAETHGPVALIHFDSHPDTWPTYMEQRYWHGSPIINGLEEGLIRGDASTQIGLRCGFTDTNPLGLGEQHGVRQFFTDEVHENGWDSVISETLARAQGHPVYLTFDIDFLDPAAAPGTGTPEAGGFTTREAIKAVRSLSGLNLVAFDMVEVLPAYDSAEITSLAACIIIHEFLALLALNHKEASALEGEKANP